MKLSSVVRTAGILKVVDHTNVPMLAQQAKLLGELLDKQGVKEEDKSNPFYILWGLWEFTHSLLDYLDESELPPLPEQPTVTPIRLDDRYPEEGEEVLAKINGETVLAYWVYENEGDHENPKGDYRQWYYVLRGEGDRFVTADADEVPDVWIPIPELP